MRINQKILWQPLEDTFIYNKPSCVDTFTLKISPISSLGSIIITVSRDETSLAILTRPVRSLMFYWWRMLKCCVVSHGVVWSPSPHSRTPYSLHRLSPVSDIYHLHLLLLYFLKTHAWINTWTSGHVKNTNYWPDEKGL